MYLVALAILPLMMLLSRLHVIIAGLVFFSLYLAVPLFRLELPAEIAFDRPWFFNPFAWQFLFYTGFFLNAGWLKAPPLSRWLIALCACPLDSELFLSAITPPIPRWDGWTTCESTWNPS